MSPGRLREMSQPQGWASPARAEPEHRRVTSINGVFPEGDNVED